MRVFHMLRSILILDTNISEHAKIHRTWTTSNKKVAKQIGKTA